MTLMQIMLLSLGIVLFGVGIIFLINEKKSGSFIEVISVIAVVAALNPTLLQQIGIGNKVAGYEPTEYSVQKTSSVESAAKSRIKTNRLITTGTTASVKQLSAADYLSLGTEARQKNDFSLAFQYANLGLTMVSDDRVRASLTVLLGSLYEAIDDSKSSAENYLAAIKIDPNYNWSYIKLGNLYTSLRRYEDAEQYYKKAIDLDPKDAWTHNNLGILYTNLKRFDEAEKSYRTAIKLNPEDAWTLNNLGVLYKDLNRYDEAEKVYKQAVMLDPTHVLAQNNLSILYKIRDGKNVSRP